MSLRNSTTKSDWLRLLGEYWSVCDNLWEFHESLRHELTNRCPAMEMMSALELAEFAHMPPVLSIYRGASARNINGASWSLDREIAVRFHIQNRYAPHGDALLATAQVRKEDVVALKLDRQEREIITFGAERIVIEKIDDPVRSAAP